MYPPQAFGTNPPVDGSKDLLSTYVHAWPVRHLNRTTHCHLFFRRGPRQATATCEDFEDEYRARRGWRVTPREWKGLA